MKPINGFEMQQPAICILPVQTKRVLGNIMTVMTHLSRFAADEPETDVSQLQLLFRHTLQSEHEWFARALSEQETDPDKKKKPIGPTDVILARWFADSKALEAIHSALKMFLGALLAPPRVRDDYGMCLVEKLHGHMDATGFKRRFAVAPALGYGRPFLECLIDFQRPQNLFQAPHVGSASVSQLSLTLAVMDLFRVNFQLFNPPEKIDNTARNDRLYGPAKTIGWLIRRFFVYCALYRLTAQRILRAPHARLRTVARSLFKQRYGDRNLDLVTLDEATENEYNSKIPLHPLGTYLEALWSHGTVQTEVGVHDAIYIDQNAEALAALRDNGSPGPCGPGELSTLAEMYAKHLARLNSRVPGGVCESRSWGWDADDKDLERDQELVEILAILRSDPELLTDLNEMARSLGWGSIPAAIGNINFVGADFALTDGVHLTVPVDQVIAGYTPLLSFGNKKAVGLGPIVLPDWHAANVEFGVLPVKGKVDILTTREHFERMRLPWSMTMSEPGIHPMDATNAFGSLDPTTAQIVTYFDNKIGAYLDPFYDTIDIKAKDSRVKQTVWDPQGESKPTEPTAQQLNDDWVAAISKEAKPAAQVTYAVRLGGEPFYGRCPVFVSRGPEVFITNDRGVPRLVYRERGNVYFGNEHDWSYSASDSDKLLALTPAAKTTAVLDMTVDELSKLRDKGSAG